MSHAETLHTLHPASGATDALVGFADALRYDALSDDVHHYAKRHLLDTVGVMIAGASGNVATQAQAENVLSGALRQLFALSENYPDLKANQNFLNLQEELTSSEDRIAYARQFYNDSVLNYNNKIQSIPSNVIARMFNFTEREYYEGDEQAREVPRVQF